MDALKEQIMLRQRALNPEKKKGEEGVGSMAQKSNLMSKFADIESADEEEEESDDSDNEFD